MSILVKHREEKKVKSLQEILKNTIEQKKQEKQYDRQQDKIKTIDDFMSDAKDYLT